ncbi:MAG: hypothetical protein NXI15_05605 [Gammaproteobacteria bacterium]|nr:hypothetical protein [Gammaproteobacteria bacterium]
MQHYLLEQYPEGVVLITDFGDDHPEILSTRKSRNIIDRLAAEPRMVQKVFRKRFNRWYVHIPSLIEYLENQESLVREHVEKTAPA